MGLTFTRKASVSRQEGSKWKIIVPKRYFEENPGEDAVEIDLCLFSVSGRQAKIHMESEPQVIFRRDDY